MARVTSSARSGTPPGLVRTEAWPVCLPVISVQRVGAQTLAPACIRVNRIPSVAIRSMFGVFMRGCPMPDDSK